MRNSRPAVFAFLAIAALSAPAQASMSYEHDLGCKLIGMTVYKLAEQRDAGVPAATATIRVNSWLKEFNRTGSHYRADYQTLVSDLAGLVYSQESLRGTTFYQFGLHSCGLGAVTARDPEKSNEAGLALMGAAQSCQDRFPAKGEFPRIRDCLSKAAVRIREKLR